MSLIKSHLIPFLIYPVTSIFTNIYYLLRFLWNSRIMLHGDWMNYNMFAPFEALNTYFYKTRALNLAKYGRTGWSPFLGLGNYPLARMFHYNFLSFYAFWQSSNAVIMCGIAGFLAAHFMWLGLGVTLGYFIASLLVFVLGSVFYKNIYSQNYNILGWMFFPMIFFAFYAQDILILGIAVFLVSLFSFTAWFLGSILIIFYFLTTFDFAVLLTLILPGIKVLTQFYPFLTGSASWTIIGNVARAIGVDKRTAKYKRNYRKVLNWNLQKIFYLALNIFFLGAVYFIVGELPLLFGFMLAISVVNFYLVRFMDEHSVFIVLGSCALATCLHYENYWLLAPLWIATNPFPLSVNVKGSGLLLMPTLKPFRTKKIEDGLHEFFSVVKQDERVLGAYQDPGNNYKDVFDRLRVYIEVPHYIATVRGIHYLPEWWSVFELNYEGAPSIWGNDPDSVLENLTRFNANYVIVYQLDNKILDDQWIENGFEVLNEFDWDDFPELKRDARLQMVGFPKWWLLRPPRT